MQLSLHKSEVILVCTKQNAYSLNKVVNTIDVLLCSKSDTTDVLSTDKILWCTKYLHPVPRPIPSFSMLHVTLNN